jgi:hypothetical protein
MKTLTSNEIASLKLQIEALAEEAARRCGQSHNAYVRFFSEAVDAEFGGVDNPIWKQVESIARERDYCTPEELRAADEEMAEQGYCSHGLTFWTCPAGCFE